MNQITTKDKITNNKPLTDNRIIMFMKDLLRPTLSLIAGFRVPYKVVIEEPCHLLPDKPVIYAVNHSCFADTPIMGRITLKRSYILSGKQRLGVSDWLYFILNGVIFVDRKDKDDMAASKLAMTAYLSKSRSIIMFPEGTWNLTENRLMLPMKWGVIDVAQESGGRSFPPFWNTAGSRKSALSDSENRWWFPRMTAKQKLLPLCVIPWRSCAGRFGNAMDFSAGKNWIWMQSGRNCSILWRNIRPLTGHTKTPASIIRIPNRRMYGRAW